MRIIEKDKKDNLALVNNIITLVRGSDLSGLNLNRLLGYIGRNIESDFVGLFEYVEYPFRAKLVTTWQIDKKHIWPLKYRNSTCREDDDVKRLLESKKLTYVGQRISVPERLVDLMLNSKVSEAVVIPVNLNENNSIWGFVLLYNSSNVLKIDAETKELLKVFEYLVSSAYVKVQVEKELRMNLQSLQSTEKAILNVLEDAEAEKMKSQYLANDLEKFKLAVDGASDHIIITDPTGVVLYANKSVESITGFSPEEVVGKNPGMLWGGIMPDGFYKDFWNKIFFKKEIFIGEINNKRKNGEEYIAEAHVTPILNGNGEVIFFVGIERDITKAKEIDRMKTEFISLASHQLRTPLSAIRWYVEMLVAGDAGALNDSQKDFVENISKSTVRMIDLVNGLLNISRIESGRIIIDPKPTNLKELINGVRDDIQVKLKEKEINLIVNMHADLPKITLDYKLIRNVFINLLTNAIKYSDSKTTVTIIVSKKEKDLIFQISDEGYGIPQSEQEKVFQKFFRATNAVKVETDGNGLGLYLVKSIIDSSGGKIWFKSKVGEGSTFWFTLPIKGVPPQKGEVTIDS